MVPFLTCRSWGSIFALVLVLAFLTGCRSPRPFQALDDQKCPDLYSWQKAADVHRAVSGIRTTATIYLNPSAQVEKEKDRLRLTLGRYDIFGTWKPLEDSQPVDLTPSDSGVEVIFLV